MLALVSMSVAQDTPTDIVKSDLPKQAECVVCASSGEAHGMERPAAGVMYKGKPYYFCNKKEVGAFKKNPDSFAPLVLPREMPEFGLSDTTGKVWDAEAMKGKLVLIDFWATWCGPCKEMLPVLDKLHSKYKDKGFELLSVSVDQKKADLDRFLKSHPFPNPVVHDTAGVYAKWGVRLIPAAFLVKDGKIVAQWVGVVKEEDMNAKIDGHLKSKN